MFGGSPETDTVTAVTAANETDIDVMAKKGSGLFGCETVNGGAHATWRDIIFM